MKAEDAHEALTRRAAVLRAAGEHPDTAPLMNLAREVAGDIRATAARSGHHVGIRVVERGEGIRVTITGPAAMRYKTLAERAFSARLPAAKTELRAQITRRIR